MTQDREQVNKIAEFNSLFIRLDDMGQNSALSILRSLEFAQSIMEQNEQPCKPSENYSA